MKSWDKSGALVDVYTLNIMLGDKNLQRYNGSPNRKNNPLRC